MHFEILVEDQSGKKALDILITKLIGLEQAEKFTPHMDVNNNASPSFSYLRRKVMEIIGSLSM